MRLKINFPFLILSCFLAHSTLAGGWTFLEEGDPIRVVAPGFGKKENLDNSATIIRSLGFTPDILDDLIETQRFGFANTDSYRIKDLAEALTSEERGAVWGVRGGRGSSKIVHKLSASTDFRPAQRLFIGFSDLTAVHLLLNVKFDRPSLHAPVLAFNANSKNTGVDVNNETCLEDIVPILLGKQKTVDYTFTPLNNVKVEGDYLDGSIIGGNASLIQRSIGTSIQPLTEGKFLFLEDVGEDATRLFEMATQLEEAGLLTKPKAVLLGSFSSTKVDAEIQDALGEIAERLGDNGIPVFQSDFHGHGPKNFPLPLNTPAFINTNGSEEAKIRIRTNRK